ncbi:MAG: 30S ribosomal protein S4 [Acidobacteriota bacterium]|nr:30S ribosomal protein S4 [Acidobacteriota bacterium]NLT32883.1 30S ribosomal protein S4 [Acidobacteriota bacterium]
MARYRDAKCRLCRREGTKLFLKGDRCFRDTCAVEKRNFPPGQHGHSRRPPRTAGYGVQLREKQKVKRIYRVLEKQFANYFAKADKMKGVTGENLLMMLERRLDNVVHRLGMAPSRDQARQLVTHGHIQVNGKKVDIVSAPVSVGDTISLVERMRKNQQVLDSVATISGRGGVPAWLTLDADALKGTVVALPKREDIQMPIDEQLIVELYSK